MHDYLAPALLILSASALAWFQRNDVRTFKRFRAVEDPAQRQRTFLRWAARGCAVFLGMPLVGLALIGRLDAIWHFPAEFDPLRLDVSMGNSSFLGMLFGAIAGGAILGGLLAVRRRKPAKAPPGLDITPMLPRNRAELLRIVPLIVNAGVSEEVCFRVYLPLLIVLSGGSPALAFGATVLFFGLLHRYQGWLGVLLTSLLGAAFVFLYLAIGTLFAPIVFHLLVNANALLLRPALRLRFPPRSD